MSCKEVTGDFYQCHFWAVKGKEIRQEMFKEVIMALLDVKLKSDF